MIAHYKTKANMGIGIGLILQFGSVGLMVMLSSGGSKLGPTDVAAILAARFIGLVAMIWGCCMYAKAKGYSAGFGALGLLNLIGLIVLACLKDQCKDGVETEARGFEVMPTSGTPQPVGQSEVRPYF